MKISREFSIGVLVVITIAMLYLGINYLKGVNIFSRQVKFYALYQNTGGLVPSNSVILNGYKVGIVSDVGLNPTGDGRILVEVLLNSNKLEVPLDTELEIYDSDFFGGKAIQLLLGDSAVLAENKDTLIGVNRLGITDVIKEQIEPLKQKTTKLFSSIDSIMTNLNAMFEEPTAKSLPSIFAKLQHTIENLDNTTSTLDVLIEGNSGKLSDIFTNVESISSNLKNNNEALSHSIQNVSLITDSLAKIQLSGTIKKVDTAMEEFSKILENINNGQGSLGQLVTNDSLHTELLNASHSLDLLLNDMRIHPKRFLSFSLIGKKDNDHFSKSELEQMRKEIDDMLIEKEKDTKK